MYVFMYVYAKKIECKRQKGKKIDKEIRKKENEKMRTERTRNQKCSII